MLKICLHPCLGRFEQECLQERSSPLLPFPLSKGRSVPLTSCRREQKILWESSNGLKRYKQKSYKEASNEGLLLTTKPHADGITGMGCQAPEIRAAHLSKY